MDWLSPDFITALFSIILIDLVLAGDNAIVIGLAAKNLPKIHQRKAILWGTAGAIVIRVAATLAVVWLLKLPALMLTGGIILIGIAYKLLADKKEHEIEAKPKLWPAIRTIMIADAVMGFDNVIAVAGASHGSFALVIAGLLISVPIMVWGSTLFITLMDRFPWIIYIGSGVLAYTAGSMISGDPLVKEWFASNLILKWIFTAFVIAMILFVGYLKRRNGFFVSMNESGQLIIPQELMTEAKMNPDDNLMVRHDEKGRLVLVKVDR